MNLTRRQSVTHSAIGRHTIKLNTTRVINGMLFVAFFLAAFPMGGVAQDEIPIAANPNVLRPVNGKLPQSLNIAVFAQTCTSATKLSDGHYALWATGGLTPTNPKYGECSVTSTLTIDPSLPAGSYDIILLKDDKPVGHAGLTVMDTAAGAIPPGMAPQVDVLWTVMTQKICSDVFGSLVGKRYYCIEVKIGNNSGHALQFAGLTFENKSVLSLKVKQANSSYVSARAAPYRVSRQLRNLDDESLRDGSVIPNNSQVRTTVFVEKRALTEALRQATLDAQNAAAIMGPTSSIAVTESTIIKSEERGLVHSKSSSPYLIRRALGDLILVVDPIEYLPRVQIESSSFK